MAARSEVVAISALTRISSVRSTSWVSACSKSADTAGHCSPPLPRQNLCIAFPGHLRDGPKDQTSDVQLHIGNLEIPGLLVASRPGMTARYSILFCLSRACGGS